MGRPKLLGYEAFGFSAVGVASVSLDAIAFTCAVAISIDDSAAKALGFFIGAVFSFLANQNWVFKHRYTALKLVRFLFLYMLSLFLNVLVYDTSIRALPASSVISPVATSFVVATFISAVTNFFGLKFWVFKSAKR